MSDIANLLREAATYVGPCGDTELVEKLLAAAESLGEPTAYIVTHSDGRWLYWEPDGDALQVEPLYLAPQPAVPDGWQLVPVEPTDEMIDAGRDSAISEGFKNIKNNYRRIYIAMLNAVGGSHHE